MVVGALRGFTATDGKNVLLCSQGHSTCNTVHSMLLLLQRISKTPDIIGPLLNTFINVYNSLMFYPSNKLLILEEQFSRELNSDLLSVSAVAALTLAAEDELCVETFSVIV